MSSTYFRLYMNQVMELAKTMVVKSNISAKAINRNLETLNHTISEDPRTWKYYMNLAGEYHSTDEMMYVTSMDTLETIPFIQESFEIHRATRDAYSYGTRFYQDLVDRYPHQESLILGILNPIPKNKAIAAREHEIIFYDTTLVESQELTLISSLQFWIDSYFNQWSNPAYATTDDYYPAAILGVMFAHLPLEILNARMERTRTNEVHSFHMEQYFASHGRLESALPYLNLKQSLYLYRNLRYLQRNVGKQKTFRELVERIVNERRIPLAHYEMVHNTENLLENMKPDIVMLRSSINGFPSDGTSDERTIDDLLERQYQVAPRNREEHFDVLPIVRRDFETSIFNRIPTKSLESALLDTTDSVPYTKEDTLLNHWLYLAATQRFTAIVNMTNPRTGALLQINPREAFVTYLFAINASMGIHLETIPYLCARRVQKPILPSVDELQALADKDRVPSTWIADLRSRQPAIGIYLSIQAFREYIDDIFLAMNNQRLWYMDSEDSDTRAMFEGVVHGLYQDIELDLWAGQRYEDWFAERGLEFYTLSPMDHELLYRNILTEIGGDVAATSSNTALLQEETLKLMSRLSSYNVHYIQRINNTAFRIMDTVMPRFSNIDSIYYTHDQLHLGRVTALKERHQGRTRALRDVLFNRSVGVVDHNTGKIETHVQIDPTVKIRAESHGEYRKHVPLGYMEFMVDESLTTPNAPYQGV